MAKRHGWYQFLLHDDFYDEYGNADQPDEDVVAPENHPAPKLESVLHDAELLLDFSITRWDLSKEIEQAWKELPDSMVLAALEKRFSASRNSGVLHTILEISAICLDDCGSQFIRSAWERYPNEVPLPALARASASCLPFLEGYARVTSALAQLENRKRRDLMFSLSYFNSAETLTWIEENIFEPITDSWGYLAAASSVDWQRLQAWLEVGRPLSLVAIDTLQSLQHPCTPLLKNLGVCLALVPSKNELMEVLEAYVQRDSAPRVIQRIDSILKDYDRL